MSLLSRWAARHATPPSTLMLGDCFDRMREIPDGSVDMVLCDLPYGTTQNKWDTVLPLDWLWAEYWRVCRGAVVLTAAQPFTSVLVCSQLRWFKYEWIWRKNMPTGFANAKHQPMRNHEQVCVFYKNKGIYNPQFTKSLLANKKQFGKSTGPGDARKTGDNYGGFNRQKGSYVLKEHVNPRTVIEADCEPISLGRLHPTQKPVPLFEYLVRTYTNVGATVLDNCMGSGTTGVACANSGRRFIGIERDESYFAIAERRIREAEGAARERGGVIS